MAKHKAKWPLTDDDKRFIRSAATAVWDEIAYDCLEALAFDKRKDINTVSMTRSTVVEVVMDADRLREQLREDTRTGRGAKLSDAGRQLIAIYCDYNHTQWIDAVNAMKRVVREAFPSARYGM